MNVHLQTAHHVNIPASIHGFFLTFLTRLDSQIHMFFKRTFSADYKMILTIPAPSHELKFKGKTEYDHFVSAQCPVMWTTTPQWIQHMHTTDYTTCGVGVRSKSLRPYSCWVTLL